MAALAIPIEVQEQSLSQSTVILAKLGAAGAGSAKRHVRAALFCITTSKRKSRVKVGSIILSPGYRPFHPSGLAAWGYAGISQCHNGNGAGTLSGGGRTDGLVSAASLRRQAGDENGFPPVHRQQGSRRQPAGTTVQPSAACTPSNRRSASHGSQPISGRHHLPHGCPDTWERFRALL